MLIGIDGTEANQKIKVGSGQYAYELIWSLYRINNRSKKKNSFIIFLKQSFVYDLPSEKSWWKYENIPARPFWMITRLAPRLAKPPKPDVFFSPNHYLPIFSSIPQVCTIHDLGYLMFSEQFRKKDFWQLKYWSAISIIISKYIISVSDSTKKEIVRRYPFTSKKIRTIHHGYDSEKYNTNISEILVRRVKKKYKISKNYILFLGTIKPSKNLVNIIEAFKQFRQKYSKIYDYQMVFAGKKGWLYKDVVEKEIKNEGNGIRFIGYVEEASKPALYKGAKALISPSYWEGFGMHVVESMACGTPVVVSSIPALQEVAGEAGVYVGTDSDGIAEGIERILKLSKIDYNKLVAKSLGRVKKYSWEKTGRETLKVLESIKTN